LSQSSRLKQPNRFKHAFIRIGLRFFISCYLRVRLEGERNIPNDRPYLLNFSHPNWVDPMLLVAFWPEPPLVYVFGPREEDMGTGGRNRLIHWSDLSVPFKPSKADLLDTTRRTVAVLNAGNVLSIAGEGRLSDREGAIVPLQDGAAYFALRARVPILPVAIIGTRWLRFGKNVTLRAGKPLEVTGLRANREGVIELTNQLQTAMEDLLTDVVEEPPPGPFGRWLTDIFNERPWLTDPDWDPASSLGRPPPT
jgi:1-acyl-sn-glycerol-3-phosphate acyltransferase